ncbi:MAG: peptidylprolyl isomerase [Anaerolineales bacterium]|nr:peptidylprolyl isomerase [Anaerolineales bacterium]
MIKRVVGIGGLALLVVACRRGGAPVVSSPEAILSLTPSPAEQATLTPTLITPTLTPAPLAVRVNGLEITLAEYQAELALYRAASGADLAPEDEKRVLDDLIDRALLAQAAAVQGFEVDEELLESRVRILSEQLGSEQALSDWMDAYEYSPGTFRLALVHSISAAWMRDQLTAAVPESAEQVHARQILLYNSEQANEVYALLEAGNSFDNLALAYDPITAGDLGWFPRGYLPDASLEQAAFSLEPNQYTPVIETPAGFHILQVLERDSQRPLAPKALETLQIQALQEWLIAQRSTADIQILLPRP